MYECHPSEKLKRNVKTWIGIFSSDIYVILSDQNRFNAQYWCKNHSISFIILFFWFSNSKISWKYAPIDHSARQSSGFLSGHCSSDRQPQPMVIAMLLLWNPICVSSILQVREKKTKMVNFPFFDQQVQQVFYNIQHAFNRRLGTMFKYCRFACADCWSWFWKNSDIGTHHAKFVEKSCISCMYIDSCF